ncbi:hypothetical protein [Vibrio owensii]|uniref:hypothetical protein n=1 Tax=Vibrio owensii TaxID=696485 RepID=UPI0040687831
MTNNGSVNNHVPEANEAPQHDVTVSDMYVDTSDYDIFSDLEDVFVEEQETEDSTDHYADKDFQQGDTFDDEEVDDLFDTDEVNEFEEEQKAEIADKASSISDSWDDFEEDAVIYGEMTKGDIEKAVNSHQDNSLHNEEFINFKAHVEQGYQRINEVLFESMSETEQQLQEIAQSKARLSPQDPDYHRKLGLINEAESRVNHKKSINTANAAKARKELEALQEHTRNQEVNMFKREAQKVYGSQWHEKIDGIVEGLPKEVLDIANNNLSIEMIKVLEDAQAHRKGKKANTEAVKKAGKKVRSPRSKASNSKGTGISTSSKSKLEKKIANGQFDADVFAALED